jgi:hypothetical protein
VSDFLMVWENEDGDAWVEVDAAATEEEAGTRAANQTGCVYAATGRGRINLQECECAPTHGPEGEGHRQGCLDHPGTACVVREKVDCWGFESLGDLPRSGSEWGRWTIDDAEAAIADGQRVFLPEGWTIVDGHVTDGFAPTVLHPEAPSIPMFDEASA